MNMGNNNIFIKNVTIQNVRHLKNIEIPLSENERKHLILTGRNGSGKTSVLEAIRDYVSLFSSPHAQNNLKLPESIRRYEDFIKSTKPDTEENSPIVN
jgi:recombinational DNA repair ATPase RecF